MFEKRKDSPTEGSPAILASEPRKTSSSVEFNTRNAAMIGATIKVKGEITGDENLIIEGQVEGSIKLTGHDLTVGQKGQVKADLTAKTVKIEGHITGDITGSEKVVLTKTGHVLGNIIAPRVTLEDGAKFKGSIDMDPGVASSATTAPAEKTESVVEPPKRNRSTSGTRSAATPADSSVGTGSESPAKKTA